MGKAARWIRSFFGIKKDKGNVDNDGSNHVAKKEKERRSFAKPGKDSTFNQIPADTECWLRSYITVSEKEHNHHAVAVAAATAAAAEAAISAAQAAAEVVRLTTSHGRAGLSFNGTEKTLAAVKIQTVFRGYLARKALRALKCLVKLQALVRGYLVRKRAAATLHSMQALFRAQAAARSQRARHSVHEIRARKSIESSERDNLRSKWLSASYEPYYNMYFDEIPKIVEIDTCGGARPRGINEYLNDHHHTIDVSSSPLPYPNPNRIKIPDSSYNKYVRGYDWESVVEEDYYKCATAQSTPRFAFAGGGRGLTQTSPSVCGDGLLFRASYDNNCFCPNYMTNTQSFKAKSRSYSAPKQRPEPIYGSKKKGLPLNEIMASRSSFSGVRVMQQRERACSHVREDY